MVQHHEGIFHCRKGTRLERDRMIEATGLLDSKMSTVELRPGVRRPDWSVVTRPAVQEALTGRTAARSGLIEKWSTTLGKTEDLVWRSIMELFPTLGRPPRVEEIASATKMNREGLLPVLRELRQRDLLAFDEATGSVTHAYPFTGGKSRHRVRLGGRTLNALCAVDALGVGAMYRQDISIESSCQFCNAEIRVVTQRKGAALGSVSPASAVVWYDAVYAAGCAATSCCPSIAFFCSDDHLRRWLASRAPQR